jgi:DNA-binding transcriptional LysR family regulator
VPKGETLYIGIQSIFVRSVLSDVVRKLPGANKGRYRFISGNANFLAENLRSGYLDLVFMLVQSESRRGRVADWPEKMIWVHAPHFVVPNDAPIPYLSRHEGYMDRKVLDLLDETNVPYRIAFSAVDLWNLAAAAEAGVGVLATLDRVKSELSRTLVVGTDKILPQLPELRAGVFFKEGFDAERNQAIVQAFVSAVRPRSIKKHS